VDEPRSALIAARGVALFALAFPSGVNSGIPRP